MVGFLKPFANFLINIFGWKISYTVKLPDKCVISIAPHTCVWDFFILMIYKYACGFRSYVLVKKELFSSPLKIPLLWVDSIPVDRNSNCSLTTHIAQMFNGKDEFRIIIAPEGSRKPNQNWRKGFYYISLKAQVPIVLAFYDYDKKEIGIGKVVEPTGNFELDIDEIKNFYRGKSAKVKKNFLA